MIGDVLTCRRLQLVTMLAWIGFAGCDHAQAAHSEATRPAAEFKSRHIDEALDEASRVVRTRGFAEDGDTWRGFVVEHDSQVTDVSMRTGRCDVVLAAGSPAVREIELHVYDSDGGEVAENMAHGARVALEYCPTQSGTYYVGLRAGSGNGLFGVRWFHGPAGLDIRLDDLFRSSRPVRP